MNGIVTKRANFLLRPASSSVRFNIVNDFTPEEEAQVREDRLLRRWDDVLRLRLEWHLMWHLTCGTSCVSHVTSGTAAPRRRTVGVKTLDLRVLWVTDIHRHSPTIAWFTQFTHSKSRCSFPRAVFMLHSFIVFLHIWSHLYYLFCDLFDLCAKAITFLIFSYDVPKNGNTVAVLSLRCGRFTADMPRNTKTQNTLHLWLLWLDVTCNFHQFPAFQASLRCEVVPLQCILRNCAVNYLVLAPLGFFGQNTDILSRFPTACISPAQI